MSFSKLAWSRFAHLWTPARSSSVGRLRMMSSMSSIPPFDFKPRPGDQDPPLPPPQDEFPDEDEPERNRADANTRWILWKGVALGMGTAAFGIAAIPWLVKQFTGQSMDFPVLAFCSRKNNPMHIEMDPLEGTEGLTEDEKCRLMLNCLYKREEEENLMLWAKEDLEKALDSVKPDAVANTEAAVKALGEATCLIKKYMDKIYAIIELEDVEDIIPSPKFEELWCEVYEIALQRHAKVTEALCLYDKAGRLLKRLKYIIDDAKTQDYISCSPLLVTAEQTFRCATIELKQARANLCAVESDSELADKFKNAVQIFRKLLREDLDPAEQEKLFTGICKGGDDCRLLLVHARNKLLEIQKTHALELVLRKKVPECFRETYC